MEQRSARTRIADVAREAGVSKTAVSFAFNSPDRLAPETAVRIQAVAESLGYRPHPVARSLARRRTGIIGILTPQAPREIFDNPYHVMFAAGVATAAEEAGYALQFISPLHGSLARALDRASVDGIIAVGLDADHPEVANIRGAGFSLVLVDAAGGVNIDDEGGAHAAAQHLAELGHRDVLVLSVEPPEGSEGAQATVAARRLRGYERGFAEAGIPFRRNQVVITPTSIAGGRAALIAALEDGRRPTAILAMSDVTAIGVLQATREYGIRVPDELSVVGFDDIDFAPYTNPPLTSVHQPIRAKGEAAVRSLLRKGDLDPSHAEAPRLDVRLVIRGSTGIARRHDRRWPPVEP